MKCLFPAALLLRLDNLLYNFCLLHQERPEDPSNWVGKIGMIATYDDRTLSLHSPHTLNRRTPSAQSSSSWRW